MSQGGKELGRRIRALRQRHFGRGGKREFANALETTPEEYERFERGTIPSGEMLVRMCQVTGEDLQWLLTGVASRGTMVISGTRDRHHELIAKLARLLEAAPESAPRLEAFIDLLGESARVGARVSRAELPPPVPRDLVPILRDDELPGRIDAPTEASSRPAWLPVVALDAGRASRRPAMLCEPVARIDQASQRELHIVRVGDHAGDVREFVESRHVADCFPDMFGVWIGDDALSPLLCKGDVALVAASAEATVGHPAVCRFSNRPGHAWGVWLGSSDECVTLGRLSDDGDEVVAAAEVLWSLEVLYRVRPAA